MYGKGDRAGHSLAQRCNLDRCLHESLGDHRLHRGAGERLLADEHLIQHAAQRINVTAAVHRFTHCLFGAHVRRRAHAHPDLGEGVARDVAHGLADAKVGDHRVAVLEHDVLGLDVAMHDTIPVSVIERARHFGRDAHGFVDWELWRGVEPVAQRLPLGGGHHVKQCAVGIAGIEEGEDVRVIELRGEPDLAEETFRAHGLRDVVP